ncbi:MAG: mechanosensitive ion channel, partial [Phaeodactylibacter sp.]|nr:mechanosensitive ion channel [Phaeodactylibacter sp.]
IGEKVKIGDVEGRVLHMDNASMTIKTAESIVIVPLSKLTSENVEKFSEWLPPTDEEE